MKKIIECAVCHTLYRKGKMYRVKIERGQPKWFQKFLKFLWRPYSVELICPECNRQAGYRSRKKDFERGGEKNENN